MRVEALDVRYRYGPNLPDTLKGISLDVPEGSLYGIIGPNGSGKSTLLRVIGGIARPSSGMVLYDGRSIAEFSPRQAAQTVAAVASGEPVIFPFTVEEIVMMGRSPYLRPLQSESPEDIDLVAQAMDRTGVTHLASRRIMDLSTGERQRVLIARALAQQPKVLLLDEPTAHLDVNYQVEIMELAVSLAHDSGITTIAVLHDLNLAGRYCDILAMIKDGQVAAEGCADEVLTEENLLDVYGVRAVVARRPEMDRPAVFVLSGSSTLSEGETANWGGIADGHSHEDVARG
jgi:iron complex transport system ATP-binding protein